MAGGEGQFEPTAHPATGRQEVVIETPRHDLDPAIMSDAELGAAVEGYHARYRALSMEDPEAHVILFRNRGAEAGNSLIHAHAQLYAVREPVPDIDRRFERARRFHADNRECLLCALERLEPEAHARIVAENESFVARVPWAPVTALEVWVLPKRHHASFASAGRSERADLAAILGWVFRSYGERGGDPSYNAIWHSARMRDATAPHQHWFVQLRPRLARPAGFELTAGVDICPSDPVADAALLRG
jgi:UDPglucose--hexose-1-phosphate uridylyltransferase